MQNYKMTIAYDGRQYKGYRKTKSESEKCIQGKLETILKKLFEEEVEVISAVSTDAGVHATAQVVNFVTPDDRLSADGVFDYFEQYLPDDIIVLDIEEVDERFHSRYNVENLTYEYRIWKNDAPRRPLFDRKYVNFMNQKLNVSLMKEAASTLAGEHDFTAFTTNKKVKNPVKTVVSVDVNETECEIIISMTADGFLLNMERIIVGTLIQVGLEEKKVNTIEKAFESLNFNDAGHKASADALCLVNVKY